MDKIMDVSASWMEADMYPDYHVHTAFSGDSDTPPQDQILRAIELGMPAICITDHQDFDFPEEEYGISFEFDTDSYIKEMTALRDRFKDRIEMGIGVELGLQDHLKDRLDSYVREWDFDYVIGSIHLVRHKDPYYPEYFEGRSAVDAFREYFETVLGNINIHDCYDALGHLDYIVRYTPDKRSLDYPCPDLDDIIDEILKVLVSKGKALEVNTAGLRSGLGFPNPHSKVIRRYLELGGEYLILGSDAHQSMHLAYAFAGIHDFLECCGVRYLTRYEDRKPIVTPL